MFNGCPQVCAGTAWYLLFARFPFQAKGEEAKRFKKRGTRTIISTAFYAPLAVFRNATGPWKAPTKATHRFAHYFYDSAKRANGLMNSKRCLSSKTLDMVRRTEALSKLGGEGLALPATFAFLLCAALDRTAFLGIAHNRLRAGLEYETILGKRSRKCCQCNSASLSPPPPSTCSCQLTLEVPNLCIERIKKDLKERRAQVLAEAAEARMSICNARCNFGGLRNPAVTSSFTRSTKDASPCVKAVHFSLRLTYGLLSAIQKV